MLVEFTVANFRSLHAPQTWNMVASAYLKEWEDRNTFQAETRQGKGLRLLRTAALYGPNAAGKSTLVQALAFMQGQVVNSARESQQDDPIEVTPFKLTAESRAADSEFSAIFIEQGVRYEYGFRCNTLRFTEEWLYAYPLGRPQKWFHRVLDPQTLQDAYDFSPSFQGGRQRQVWAVETRANALFLSRCMQSNNEQLKPVFQWFSQRLRVIATPNALGSDYTARRCEDVADRAKVLEFLNAADLSIDGIRLESRPFSSDMLPDHLPEVMRQELMSSFKGKEFMELKFQRKDASTGEMVEFEEHEESDGTRALLAFAGPWLDVLENHRVLVVDELDSSLHPLVVRHLVSLLQHAGTQAQLLFTTHDTTLLSQKLLRRDQVWFIEKNAEREARLYPLSEFSPRENEAIERGYLNGRYGGIPNLQELDFYGG
jgi:hypothetical protein